MSIYLIIVAATLILGAVMPQRGRKRIYYIVLMTAIHAFVCAFRYNHLTGDLMKYHYEFNTMAEYDWFSQEVLHEGRNSGFYLLMKLVNEITGGDFQILLIVIAVVTHVILGYMVYRYSPAPWMSFFVWNCMSFYIFGFNAIKQALAMAFIMLSWIGIFEKKFWFYLMMIVVAALIHTPALIFLPAYWLTQKQVSYHTIALYVVLGVLLYVLKDQFVDFIRSFYYDDDEVLLFSGTVGNRFVMLLGFTIFGVLLMGFRNGNFEKMFHLMAIATILQMLAGFDNIFTRLTDYYFQISVLYIPMTFHLCEGNTQRRYLHPVFPFNKRSMTVLTVFISLFMFWFYWNFSGVLGDWSAEGYSFMWEVS